MTPKTWNKGDVLFTSANGKYRMFKVLEVDQLPQHTIHHVLIFAEQESKPTLDDVTKQTIWAYHMPVETLKNVEQLGNVPVKEEEKIGFYEYLKRHDLQRYLKETDQNIDEYVGKVSKAFGDAVEASEKHNHEQAIKHYDEAVDLMPSYFEALDNRGMEKIELVRYQEALQDFEASLRIEPNGLHATAMMGECYLRLQEYEKGLEWMKNAAAIDPNHPQVKKYLALAQKMASTAITDEMLGLKGNKAKKPWWKIW